MGREATPEEYVSRITAVFHEVKRVLTPEGTCWLNIADTYCGTGSKADHQDPKYPKGRNGQQVAVNHRAPGCKPKDLIGIPWLVALALRGDGWYLRSSIIWHKGNAMPESTRDRPTRCYEYVFLLTKSKKYYYDWQAVAEPIAPTTAVRLKSGVGKGNKYAATVPGQNQPQKINRPRRKGAYTDEMISPVRSRRNVWQINTTSYRGGHFAAFPPKLAETCILAGCPVGGIVLDPFLGSGTTAAAAKSLSRRYIGIEINPEYCTLAKQRIGGDEH
ncbi:TPA: site-specific DNA-methyltransferase [Clostridioides difficile]|nr:site-specific DNA-methyltransferase [Clostridioides difficile]